jgi:hypothetical protein
MAGWEREEGGFCTDVRGLNASIRASMSGLGLISSPTTVKKPPSFSSSTSEEVS